VGDLDMAELLLADKIILSKIYTSVALVLDWIFMTGKVHIGLLLLNS